MQDKEVFTDSQGRRYRLHGTMPMVDPEFIVIKPVAAEPERWQPQEGDLYWYINRDGQARQSTFFKHLSSDQRAASIGNALKSEDGARCAGTAVRALFNAIHAHADDKVQAATALASAVAEAHYAIYHGYREDGDAKS
jgi:hypothetical protein